MAELTAPARATDDEVASPVLCPRCRKTFRPTREGKWVFVSCAHCGKTVNLTGLVKHDGVLERLEPPSEWPQYLTDDGPLEISASLLAAARLAGQRLEAADVRYEAGHPRYGAEIFHLNCFLKEHAAAVGEVARVSDTHAGFLAAAAHALRQVVPDDGEAMRAANELETAQHRHSYAARQELPNTREAYAARELLRLMKDISEDAFCAQWLPGQEYTIWEGMQDRDSLPVGWRTALTPGRALRLQELAKEAAGWWTWPNEEFGAGSDWLGPTESEVFVPLDVWRAHAAR